MESAAYEWTGFTMGALGRPSMTSNEAASRAVAFYLHESGLAALVESAWQTLGGVAAHNPKVLGARAALAEARALLAAAGEPPGEVDHG